ncbi:hypothetical protein LB504_010020 [Fusarium proliferatum]|nr:hypothetical protein LB504_010020 [Fusarium proliferatum]
MSDQNHIRINYEGNFAIITLNNPNKFNSLTQSLFSRLASLLREIDANKDVYVTLLIGEGPFFSAGADLKDSPPSMEEIVSRPYWLPKLVNNNLDVARAFYSHSKILVTALNGPVIGLSAALISHSDFIYAVPDAYLLTPFSSLGLVAEGGASVAFVHRMGPGKANEALILGRKIPVSELVQVGFVNRVFEDKNNFRTQVLEYVRQSFSSHLVGSSLLGTKALMRRRVVREQDEMAPLETFQGVERFCAGIPQEEMGKSKRRPHRDPLMLCLDQGKERPRLAMLVTHAKSAAASHKLEAPAASKVSTELVPLRIDRSLTDVLYRPRNGARTRRGQNLPRAPSDAESITLDRASHNEPVYRPFTDHFGHHSQAREPDTATPQAQAGLSPVYGDTQGVGLVADLCEPERPDKSGHFVAAALSSTNVDSDTHEYLEKRGCFDLPTFDIQQSLVQAYFHYVHPFLPAIHVSSFIKAFESPGQDGVSLHLLWSVFLAAANFADATTVQLSGYESRKDMKLAMFLRAKALYDANYERSKIVLIQAVLLMGFWYSDTEDRLGPWHWNGIAISLCQTVGLHREPDASLDHSQYRSSIDRHLWKHLWWCCFFRETWLSVGMGRPMRINSVPADTPKPDANASESLYSELTDSQRRRYIPQDPENLFLLWDDLLSVTSILSRILSVQHLAKRTLSTHSEVNDLERELRGHHKHLDYLRAGATDPVLTLHMYHFELFFDCIALVPTLQIHLLHSVSPRKLVHRLSCHRLDMCMMVVQEIKATYFGAEILYRLFTRAREVTSVRRRVQETPPPAGTDESAVVMPVGQRVHDRETSRPASPMIWAFNAASNYGHGTGTSDEFEDTDVNAILSQCIFPDFGTFQTMGLTDITQPWT